MKHAELIERLRDCAKGYAEIGIHRNSTEHGSQWTIGEDTDIRLYGGAVHAFNGFDPHEVLKDHCDDLCQRLESIELADGYAVVRVPVRYENDLVDDCHNPGQIIMNGGPYFQIEKMALVPLERPHPDLLSAAADALETAARKDVERVHEINKLKLAMRKMERKR